MLKKVGAIVFYCCCFPVLSNASIPGFYLLGQLGTANTHLESSDAGALASSGKMVFTGRIAGGYQFNQHLAFEIGYTRFSDVNFSGVGGVPGQNISLQEKALDFIAKPMLPLSNNFNIYTKLGLAYFKANGSAFVNGRSYLGYSDSWDPTFGIGFSYDLTPAVTIDLSWLRIQNVGSHTAPSTDFYSVGLAYYFG